MCDVRCAQCVIDLLLYYVHACALLYCHCTASAVQTNTDTTRVARTRTQYLCQAAVVVVVVEALAYKSNTRMYWFINERQQQQPQQCN